MKFSTVPAFTLFAAIVLIICSYTSYPVFNPPGPNSAADTVYFEPNTFSGWTTYSYYLHENTSDSIEFELILKHDPDIQYWTNEQLIGTIKGFYVPQKEQNLNYYLLINNRWHLRIAKDGKCYLKVITGDAPAGSTVVIPIKVKYKKAD